MNNRYSRYRDLDLDFDVHPTTKDVIRKFDVEAIKRSVRHLILTQFGEKPFQPEIGSRVMSLLFEPISPLSAIIMEDEIRNTIENFEPRVRVTTVLVSAEVDSNRFDIQIIFDVIAINEQVRIDFFLDRVA